MGDLLEAGAREYDVLKLLGRGQYGRVYLCQRRHTSEKLVIKVVEIESLDANARRQALAEYQILKKFSGHPCIVSYKDCMIENKQLMLVMDYCEGGDLGRETQMARRNGERIPESKILAWLAQAALGLREVHHKKVLHRDLKPSNILLDWEGRVKLADFGVSRTLASTIAMAHTMIGTPYYMSPELWQDKPYAAPSDIWALGITIFEIACLDTPFKAATSLPQLAKMIQHDPIPMLPSFYSFELQQLVSQMLSRDPNKRPTCDKMLQTRVLYETMKRLALTLELEASPKKNPPPLNTQNNSKNFGNAQNEQRGTYGNTPLFRPSL